MWLDRNALGAHYAKLNTYTRIIKRNCQISFIFDCCGLTSIRSCFPPKSWRFFEIKPTWQLSFYKLEWNFFSGKIYVHFIWCWTSMHALTFHKTCAGSPTTEKKGKITKAEEFQWRLCCQFPETLNCA